MVGNAEDRISICHRGEVKREPSRHSNVGSGPETSTSVCLKGNRCLLVIFFANRDATSASRWPLLGQRVSAGAGPGRGPVRVSVATTISGMDSMEVLDQNLTILRDFKTLSADRMQILRDHGKQFDDGRYELYKSTIKYDRDLGRSQHGYPSSAELPV